MRLHQATDQLDPRTRRRPRLSLLFVLYLLFNFFYYLNK